MVLGAELACPECGGLDIEVSNPGGDWDLQTELGPDPEGVDEISIRWSCFHCNVCETAYHFHSDGTIHLGCFPLVCME